MPRHPPGPWQVRSYDDTFVRRARSFSNITNNQARDMCPDACMMRSHGDNLGVSSHAVHKERGCPFSHLLSRIRISVALCILLLACFPARSAAQSTTFVPDACQTVSSASSAQSQQACQQALFESINSTVDYYTITFSSNFKACVKDPIKERELAFDFSANLTFLTTCLVETEPTMLDRLCSGAEIKAYIDSLVNLIESSNSGSPTPPIANVNCNESHWDQGCEDGWSTKLKVGVPNIIDLYQNFSTVPMRDNSTRATCCAGFYCPRGLSCMIPCPLGALCPKATSVNGLCSPYNYEVTPGQGFTCGGANLWADLSNSNGTFCPGGSYCPSTTDVRKCTKGFFCRQGSTTQSKCFHLTSCSEETTNQHIQTYGIMIIVVLTATLLLVYNCSDQVMQFRGKRQLKQRERAVRQVQGQLKGTQRWESGLKKMVHSLSSNQRIRSQEMPVLSPFVRRSHESHPTVDTIDEETDEETSPPCGSLPENHSVEEGMHVPVEAAHVQTDDKDSSSTKKHSRPRTTSQILRYAYEEIEKEKAIQNSQIRWQERQADQEQHALRRRTIEIQFKDLSLYLKGSGKKILANVTGQLLPRRVTAVMGPSGAGKTTFLNALAGKAYFCTTSGEILINGRPDPIRCYKKIIGFVPQDDIVHGNLTVEENLWFSARYRLPVRMTRAEKVLVVERIIDSLGLGAIRNSKVGTVEKRGISGGQRKRVNVGLEMVMEPSLLILDEPTSGLDSTSSQFVLKALRREALAGVNVGVVLHQPSYELFKLFDDVMFLAKGGRTVYLGPVDKVENYFASLGIIVPERINPPDHFMDVLEGMKKPEGNSSFDPKMLPVKWIQHNNYQLPTDLRAIAASSGESFEEVILNNEDDESSKPRNSFTQELWQVFKTFWVVRWDALKHTFGRREDFSERRTPGFFSQFKLIIKRLALQRFREARLQTQDYLILLLCGACLGVITPSKDSSLGSNNYSYVIIALPLLCMISALRTFSNEKLQYWRESASSINRVAYFLAKDTVDHFNTVIKPVFFLSMFYFFNNPRSSFQENYIVTLAMVYCVTGIAYVFAITLDSGPAQLWSVFLPIICTLVTTQKGATGFLKTIQYATYARWALEAYVIANANRYSGVWLITRCVSLYGIGYDINDWALCLSILFTMGFIARFIALLCLMLCNRSRQQ